MTYTFRYNPRDKRVTIGQTPPHDNIIAFTLENVGPVVAWLIRDLVRQANRAEASAENARVQITTIVKPPAP